MLCACATLACTWSTPAQIKLAPSGGTVGAKSPPAPSPILSPSSPATTRRPPSWESPAEALGKLRDALAAEADLLIIFGPELRGEAIDALVAYGAPKGAKFICLADYANSRGAADMGLYPDLLPGYHSVASNSPATVAWKAEIPTHSRPRASANARPGCRRRSWKRSGSSAPIPPPAMPNTPGVLASLPGCAGYVPHRNRAARRRFPARGLRL